MLGSGYGVLQIPRMQVLLERASSTSGIHVGCEHLSTVQGTLSVLDLAKENQ